MRAEVLDLKLKAVLRTVVRACWLVPPTCTHTLERHVLEKVGRAVVALCLRTRASVNPRTHRGRLSRWVGLRSHGKTVGQHRHLCEGLTDSSRSQRASSRHRQTHVALDRVSQEQTSRHHDKWPKRLCMDDS